jgi:hypothetical protein
LRFLLLRRPWLELNTYADSEGRLDVQKLTSAMMSLIADSTLARSIGPSLNVGPTTVLLPRDVERILDNLVTKIGNAGSRCDRRARSEEGELFRRRAPGFS